MNRPNNPLHDDIWVFRNWVDSEHLIAELGREILNRAWLPRVFLTIYHDSLEVDEGLNKVEFALLGQGCENEVIGLLGYLEAIRDFVVQG